MNYYQEITIIDSNDKPFFKIWSDLYIQVHLALVEQAKAMYGKEAKHGDIGVSFPEYACFEKNGETIAILGSKLRVFAKTKAELEALNLNQWLERLTDYVHIKSIQGVPENSTHIIVKRFRQTKNQDGKTRNFAQKYGKTFEEVKTARIEHIAKTRNISLEDAQSVYDNPVLEKRPYIVMDSKSNKHKFSLEIEQIKVGQPKAGTFSTYGLSPNSTVPDWGH